VVIVIKAINECKWDPTKTDVFVLYALTFLSFFVNIGLVMANEAETSSQ